MWNNPFTNPFWPLDPNDPDDQNWIFLILYIGLIAFAIWAVGKYKFNLW